jgi:hypothetical protein|tara:strand:+ start:252 stop:452 length:201 start_codon:yes stop_codon:yes gene_type:complete
MKAGDKVELKSIPIIMPSCGGSVYMDENPTGTIIEMKNDVARVRWLHINNAVSRVQLNQLQLIEKS